MKLWLALTLILLLFAPSVAKACTAPAGVEGQFLFNHDYNLVQYCDANSVWVKLGGSTTDARIGTLTANKWCAANAGGTGLDCTQNTPTAGITALTGDVTASGSGSVAATIAANAVTYAKIQNTSAASVLLGRGAGAGAGLVKELTIGSGLSLSGTTLSATASGTVSGTTNYVAKFTGATTIGNSQIFDNGTSVGIGLTPKASTSLLTVNGDISLTTGSAQTLHLNSYYSSGWKAYNAGYSGALRFDSTTGQLQFMNSASSVAADATSTIAYSMVINANGNVGIGTTAPSTLLDVNGNAHFSGATYVGIDGGSGSYLLLNSSSTGYNAIGFANAGTEKGRIQYQNSNDSLQFATLNTERMRINSAGNVGIGTTNIIGVLTVGAGTDRMLNVRGDPIAFGLPSGLLGPILQGVNSAQISTEPITLFSTSTNLMGGNVGIGTVAPSYKLTVSGDGTTSFLKAAIGLENTGTAGRTYSLGSRDSGNFVLGDETAGAARITINSIGNVGIGTAAPTVKLHASGSGGGGGAGLFESTDAWNSVKIKGVDGAGVNDTAFLLLQDAAAENTFIGTTGTAGKGAGSVGDLRVSVAGTERLRISKTTGNVGIGTTGPAGTLDVHGATGLVVSQGFISYSSQPAYAGGSLCYSALGQSVASYYSLGACSSDRRIKSDIRYLPDGALQKIMAIKPANFLLKDDPSHTRYAGFIAQDTMGVIPEAVPGTTSNGLYRFESNAVLSYAVKAIQELKADNDNLRAENAAEIKELREEIRALKASSH